MLSYRRFALSVTCIVLLALSVPAGADVRTWDGGGSDTEWATAGNWDPDGYANSDNLTVLSGTPMSAVNVYADNGGSITLDGSAAVANFSAQLYIAYNPISGESTLNILGGGAISNTNGYLGYYPVSSGTATVSGAGSTWTNSGLLYVGNYGAGTLNITSGGTVSSKEGYFGYSSCGSGTATVSGTGSTWNNSGNLYVGRYGTGSLTVENGGTVNTQTLLAAASDLKGDGTINVKGLVFDTNLVFDATHGVNQVISFGTGGTLNLSVDGTGSLGAGYRGTASIMVADGVKVTSANGYLGYNSGSTGTATVSGAGSTWTNSSYLHVGNYGTGELNITGGGAVSNTTGYLGYDSGSSGTATVSGEGSTWANSSVLYVGNRGTGTLTITDSGTVSSTDCWLGYSTGSTGTATVSGIGSTWTNSGALYVGNSGTGSLTVENGGTVNAQTLLAAASDLKGDGTINVKGLVFDTNLVFDATHGVNQAFSFGTGGTLNLSVDGTGSLGAGYRGTASIMVADGVNIVSANGYLGYNSGSTGTATISGAGSTWTNSGELYVGESGTGELNITGGGAVSNTVGYMGYNSGSSGTATISGAGSTWTNSGELYVGESGTGELNITGGGAVSNTVGYLGHNSGSSGTVTVSGAGSTWTNNYKLYVGYYGTGALSITDGGAVSNSHGYVGHESSSSGTVTVSGAGSKWTNSGGFYVGLYGHGTGVLNITDGGVVSSSHGYVGYFSGSSGTVKVNGDGSRIYCEYNLSVGRGGTGVLKITDGGYVRSYKSYLGFNTSSLGTATISGTGSEWYYGSELYVGESGTGVLSITNGGSTSGGAGYLGYNTGSSGTVTVSGAGSMWTTDSNPYVGYYGTGVLNITDGGVVSNTHWCSIGHHSSSTGAVTVDGSGSTWNCDVYLHVGFWGQGTLNITNSGAVNAPGDTWVAMKDGSAGEIHFDGGTLTTRSLFAGATQLTGTGTINTNGLVSDIDLLFDSAHGLTQTLTLNSQPDQDITINLTQYSTCYLGAGYAGEGTISIRDGVSVESNTGYIGYKDGATGVVTVAGSGSTWTSNSSLYVGYDGHGTLNITNGGTVSNSQGFIGTVSGSTGVVTVDGAGSTWINNSSLHVGYGYKGHGTLNITNGGAVSNSSGYIGYSSNSTGVVAVDGSGSIWTNSGNLYVGYDGQGTLNITNGGLVSVAGTLTIDNDGDGDSFINMATGGMLALYGDADDSLADFLDMIGGTAAIRYWDASASDWADITGATYGQDYTLAYLTEGDLTGYTVLTVPEPVSAVLLLSGGILVMFRRRRKK